LKQDEELEWEAWWNGAGRCPYCVGIAWRDFEAICDCWERDREASRPARRVLLALTRWYYAARWFRANRRHAKQPPQRVDFP
jgi:hypothetical protein